MNALKNATAEAKIGGEGTDAREQSELLTVGAVSRLLSCSKRQVYRLSDAAKMPRPIRLGGLVRWPRATIMEWIGQGCPAVRAGGRP